MYGGAADNAPRRLPPCPPCLQVLVTAADWSQRTAFMEVLRSTLDGLPRRRPWYPGRWVGGGGHQGRGGRL